MSNSKYHSSALESAVQQGAAFVGIGFLGCKADGTVVWADRVALDLLGLCDCREAEAVGLCLKEIVRFDSGGLSPWERVQEQGVLRGQEYAIRLSEGSVRAIVVDGYEADNELRLVLRSGGSPEAAPESADLYRTILRSTQDVITAVDREGRHLFLNSQGSGLLLAQEVGGSAGLEVHPEDLAIAQSAVSAALEGKSTRCMLRAFDTDAQLHELIVTAAPYRKNEHLVGAVCLATDVSELRRTERDLAAEKERLAVTLRSVADAVVATDAEGRIVLMNAAAERLSGWLQEQAQGQVLGEILQLRADASGDVEPDPARRVLHQATAIEAGRPMLLRNRAGEESLIEFSAAPIRSAIGAPAGVVLVLRDVARQRKLEDELHKTQKLESLAVLAGGIAHDFNNILTSILGGIALARQASTNPDRVRELLEFSERACLRARDLTYQLLAFSRGGAPTRRPASLADLVRETAGFTVRGSNVRCEIQIPEDLWPVEIDEGQMSQVINNLLLNAVQAMPAGGVIRLCAENRTLPTAEPAPLVLEPGRYVRISVRDEGGGIAPEHLSKVFDPYFTTKPCGSGLGLAISYAIVRRHGGSIDVQSTPGHGALFTLHVPAARTVRPIERATPVVPAPAGGRVLVMDDDAMVLSTAAAMLEALGYQVELARDGAEAIERYQAAYRAERRFDVVIMDLTVPGGMGGKDAARRLREFDPKARIVASTGHCDDPVVSDHRAFGFNAVLPKPYLLDDLCRVL